MTAVLLPLMQPPVIGFVHHAYPLSILLNNPASIPWLHSNYIQLCYDPEHDASALAFNFYHYNYPYSGQYVSPYLYNIWFSKRMIVDHSSLESFVKDSIDRKFHVYVYLDEFYVPNRFSHKHGIHLAHDIMISGYDDRTREYAISGYDENGTFRLSKVSFEQAELGFRPSEHLYKDFHDNVQLFSENESDWQFRIEPVIELLKDYVLSRDTSLRCGIRRHGRKDVFGIRVYALIERYAEDIQAGRRPLDIRPFHLLWEHKRLMQDRIRYLADNGWLRHDAHLIEAYGRVERLAFEIRGHAIKASTSGDNRFLETVSSDLRLTAELETEALSLLIDQLENRNSRNRPADDSPHAAQASVSGAGSADSGSELDAIDFHF